MLWYRESCYSDIALSPLSSWGISTQGHEQRVKKQIGNVKCDRGTRMSHERSRGEAVVTRLLVISVFDQPDAAHSPSISHSAFLIYCSK